MRVIKNLEQPKSRMRPFLILFALVLFLAPAFAFLPEAHLKVFAVAPDGTALAAKLQLEIRPGSGQVWSSVSGPLVGTATQSTEKIAVKVAKNYASDVELHDYYYTIDSDASVVDGPSAGSAMALLTVSALEDRELSPLVGLTGTITNTGEVGPVGGVFEKAKEASQNGIKLFMIPQGEARQVTRIEGKVQTVYLPEYAFKNWGMKVVETRNLDDVLKYAFSDIAGIDINETAQPEVPTFIPEKITTNDSEKPLEEMNKQLIQQTKAAITDAQNALSQTLLDDSGLIEVLSTSLSDSQKSVNEAELLNQNGYYYSAGNFAYLAKVNAYFVNDVAEHPELLDPESDLLKEWAQELQTQGAAQQKILDTTVPIEGIEWYIASQQRLTWAQEKTSMLVHDPSVIVSTEDAIQAQVVGRMQDYEYARAWTESSNQFYQIALSLSTKSLKDQAPFQDYYEDYLKNVENGLTLVQDGDQEDIARRLNAAKIDQANGRHLSAAMNAASALALINSHLTQTDPKNDTRALLEEKIQELTQKMNAQPTRYAWARLYLDHAQFYLNSANYYQGINQGTAAATSIESGYALALLAENTYAVTKDVTEYYDKLPATRFSILAPASSTNGGTNGGTIPLPIGPDGKGSITVTTPAPTEIPVTGILLALAVFLAIILALSFVSRRAAELNHTELSTGTPTETPSRALFAVDQLDARLFSARQGLRHAQFQHANNQLSDEAYAEVAKHYQEQIRGLGKEMRKASSELRNGKKIAMSAMDDDKMDDILAEPPKTKPKKWPPTKKAVKKASKKK